MHLCCVVNYTPSFIRFGLGIFFWIIGLPIFILPIPLGLIFILIGTILIVGTSKTAKEKLKARSIQYPRLYKLIRPFVEQCPNCRK